MRVSLEKIRKILNFYELLDKNIVDGRMLEEVYKMLPEENQATIRNPNAMITAIKRFVILNYLELQEEIQAPPDIEKIPEVKAVKEIEEINGEKVEVYKAIEPIVKKENKKKPTRKYKRTKK